MKTTIRILITAAVLLGLNARSYADDKALAALGGFVAGIITGSAIEHADNIHAGVSVSVGGHPHYGYCQAHGRLDCGICITPGPRGYWEVRSVRIWIPGFWDFTVNHYGNRIRIWRPGHFECRPQRVWIAYREPVRYDRNRRDYRDHGRRDYGKRDDYRRDHDRRDGRQGHDNDRDRSGRG